ncbi:hypothetical protein PCASD_03964 [Puccinia coronata f. sp. avenae]|uniref:Uncharacterized protein n=1 Tax=Puccinia coronata f. sp. avenae TaxID=200324 RepID=A0A2N5VAL4_9BASI|nr:hypothetical protein PCASD_03964 [Puccinia coronata f. sp. avenae]
MPTPSEATPAHHSNQLPSPMSTASGKPKVREEDGAYQFLVVGAGPAGVTAVANLLDNGVSSIAWIDPYFSGGRMGEKYREIPSNTKIQLFLDYVAASPTLSNLVQEETETPNAYTALLELELGRGNLLSYAADLMVMLTRGLLAVYSSKIEPFHARVTSLNCLPGAGWSVGIETLSSGDLVDEPLQAQKVVLATGSDPIQPTESAIAAIDLEVALSPSQLRGALAGIPLEDQAIAVVGSSHSAFLVLRNLASLPTRVRIIHLFRSEEIRFAEQKDGWILYDNTGLKGLVAEWAKSEYPSLVEQRRISRLKIDATQDALPQHLTNLKHCARVIYAIGYQASPTPRVTLDGTEQVLNLDHQTGRFEGPAGLFGCGIAFPQRVVDPAGNVELAVGIFKFMKFLRAVVPHWIQS